jgi:hypothetical protein
VNRVITKLLDGIINHDSTCVISCGVGRQAKGAFAYLAALSKKFRRYLLLSTSGTIASVIDSTV